jgi:hypothetical protein
LIRNCAEVVGHTFENKLVGETTRVNRKRLKKHKVSIAIIKKGSTFFFLHFFQDLPVPGTNLGSALIQPMKVVG